MGVDGVYGEPAAKPFRSSRFRLSAVNGDG